MTATSNALAPKPDDGSLRIAEPIHTGTVAGDEGPVAGLLRRVVHASCEGSLAPEKKQIFTRIATAAVVLHRLPQPGAELLVLSAALDVASNGSPDLAEGMLTELERDLRISNHPLWSIVRGRSAALPFYVGMIVTILAMPLVWMYVQWLLGFLWDQSPHHAPVDVDAGLLLLVAWAGGLGAEISMMLRLPAYTAMARASGAMAERQTLFMAGFFRPWIGVAFAIFVYMLLKSGLVKVGDGDLNPLMYLTLAFVSGFSERLGPDLISRAEHTLRTGPSHRSDKAK